MKRLLTSGMAIGAALALGACGSGGGGGATSAAGADTVAVQRLPGVGSVLVDQTGKALYSSDQEASGKIVCSAACTAFWKPLEPGQAGPTAGSGTGKLGVIKRPDGGMQVTVNGRPLYTFSEDSPGKVTGNGFSDDFGGHHFTWHVVTSGGASKAPSSSSAGGSSGGYNDGY